MSLIVQPDETVSRRELGGKAAALALLAREGFPVPPWFVLSPQAKPADPALVRRELASALQALCPNGESVAVRSSACDEDGSAHSFAGQFESFLNVPPAEAPARVLDVWRSASSERVLAYRREHGLDPNGMAPAVLIQRMVNAEVAGVAFGADAVSGRWGVAVVCAVRGLGASLVAGEKDADTWRVGRDGAILEFRAASPGGKPALSEAQVREVAELARRTGRHFGWPQDIEWAFEKGRLWLLQSRPVTALAKTADPDAPRQLWDNSNIAESYSGITTPLTFSFARKAYEQVYREFCRLMATPPAKMAANDEIFSHMLGLIRGRVYYNLLSWYRLLTMLPGFTFNRRFMEQMMGVREGLPPELLQNLDRASRGERWLDAFHLARSFATLAVNHFHLPRRIGDFRGRLNAALRPPEPPLEEMRLDELARYYRGIERQLLTRWDAPLINDFLAMIFFGVLRQLAARWGGPHGASLPHGLMSGDGDILSAEPARRMQEMAAIAAKNESFVKLLREGSLEAVRRAMPQQADFQKRYDEYLVKFSDRCLEELKLESPTLIDDPLLLLRGVGQLAAAAQSAGSRDTAVDGPPDLRRKAEAQANAALSGHPLRRIVFRWVLKNARDRVRDRENLRFERTRLFGRARRVFVQMGRRFHGLGVLDDPRDIFYLDAEEIMGFVEGISTAIHLRALAAARRAEFDRYREQDAPSDRFETRGSIGYGNAFRPASAPMSSGDCIRGIGCCPGIVRGRVRLVTDPHCARLEKGDLLAAARTDPGWILLFPFAAGLLVEYGSVLSHSAIVAREMGIPAIVSIRGLMSWLKDGEQIELDGAAGTVRRIDRT